MMLIRCYLGKSGIEGIGVFAAEPVARGQLAWRFDEVFDILVTREQLAAAPAPVQELFARYAYEILDRPGVMALDGDDGRFMNHADDPNLDFSTPGIARAARDIAAGEELTCDYNALATEPFEMEPERNRL